MVVFGRRFIGSSFGGARYLAPSDVSGKRCPKGPRGKCIVLGTVHKGKVSYAAVSIDVHTHSKGDEDTQTTDFRRIPLVARPCPLCPPYLTPHLHRLLGPHTETCRFCNGWK